MKQEDRFADQAHLKASRPLAHSSFLERTVEQSGFGLLKIDLNTHQVVFANSRFCQMIGYSLDELTAGKITFRELTHPDDIERCTSLLHHLLRGDIESYTLEKRYLQKDGSTLPVRLTVTKLESSGDGVAPIGIISVPAAAGFAHAMPRLSTLPDGAFFWTRDLRSRSGVCSDGFKIALGLPTDGPTPSFDEFLALVHPDDRARIIEEAGRVEKGMFRTAEHRIVRPAGDVRWVSQSAKPLFDSDGEVIGMVGACLDITNERLKPEGSQSTHTVEIVKQYVDLHWDQPLNVTVLASVANITTRTLFKHCQLAWGFTPLEYIKRVRLNHARAILEMADRSTTVLGTALKCCFQNAGHFARDYRRAFGERPSETLERGRKQCRQ